MNDFSSDMFPHLSNTGADIRLLGFPLVLSPFAQFNSSPRVSMFNHHTSQSMIVDKPEFNKLFTGAEEKFIDYTFNTSRREYDCEIVAIIPKYRDPVVNMNLCPKFLVIVLTYEPNNVRRLDYFEIDRYFMGANGFGWIPEEHKSTLKQIRPGEFLAKDTPVTNSPAVKGNMYCMGTNLNVIYGSFPETVEDAFVISQSAALKLQTQQISQKTINCRMDRRPLNLNGYDKFLPDIGSHVRDDGALCAFRPVHWSTVLADTDPEALREALPLQDDIIYVESGSKILDITFNVNHHKLNKCYDQAKLYIRSNLQYWEDIYTTYITNKDKYKLTPKMGTLVRTAIYRMIAQGTHNPMIRERFRKATRNFEIEGASGQAIEFMQAVVTYTKPRTVSNGSKLTDQSGAKGVVGVVYPDDWMPVDEFGIRADLMIDMNSPVGRNNPGQLYETGINRIAEFARRKTQEVYTVQGTEAAFDTLTDFYNDVNPEYADLIREHDTTVQSKKETVEDAINDGPRVWIPPFLNTLKPSDNDFWNAITNIKSWATKWGARPSRVTYKSLQADGSGKEFTTETLFSIGSKYIFHLHKIPEIFAPGPASVNHIGVPVKATYDAKNYPVSTNPYRYGEDELRVMSMDADVREVTRLQALQANSPLGAKTTIQSILLSDHPTRIKRMPISNGKLMESNAILALFHNTTAVLGVESKSTRNDELTQELLRTLDTSNEITDSIFQSDIVDSREGQSKVPEQSGVNRRAKQKRDKVQKLLDTMSLEEMEDEADLTKAEDAALEETVENEDE